MNKKIQVDTGIELHLDIHERGKKCWLIVTHGVGEYSDRHEYLKHLFSQYYNILFWDLRGHGRSTGKRAYINNFDDYSNDLVKVMKFLKDDYRATNFVLFGHSMGALVVCNTLQNFSTPRAIEKVYLSSPPVGVPGIGLLMETLPENWVARLAHFKWSFPIKGLIKKEGLSHDPEVADLYERDPLNSMSLHSKLLLQLGYTSVKVFKKPLKYDGELYVSVGSQDSVVQPEAVKKYFSEVQPVNDFLFLEGARHEIHNEVGTYQKPYFEFLKKCLIRS